MMPCSCDKIFVGFRFDERLLSNIVKFFRLVKFVNNFQNRFIGFIQQILIQTIIYLLNSIIYPALPLIWVIWFK